MEEDEILMCSIYFMLLSEEDQSSYSSLQASFHFERVGEEMCQQESHLFWLREVINKAFKIAFDNDYRAVNVEAHEVHNITPSMLFKKR